MFERFTGMARRVLALAAEEARLLDHSYIGTEHILLGLIHEGEGVAYQALDRLDITLEAAREMVAELLQPAGSQLNGLLRLSEQARKVLEISLLQANQLSHYYVGTEHILLGIVSGSESDSQAADGSVAAKVLVALGGDLATIRQTVFDILASSRSPSEPARNFPSEPFSAAPGTSIATPVTKPVDGRSSIRLSHEQGILSGTISDSMILLEVRPGVVSGTVGDASVDLTWSTTSNYQLPQGQPVIGEVSGTWGDSRVVVSGRFFLEPGHLFRGGGVEGNVGDTAVRFTVGRALGGLSSSTVMADGMWGDGPLTLVGTIGGSLDVGWVRGVFDNGIINLIVERCVGGTRIMGEFDGPHGILIAVAAILLYFTGAIWMP